MNDPVDVEETLKLLDQAFAGSTDERYIYIKEDFRQLAAESEANYMRAERDYAYRAKAEAEVKRLRKWYEAADLRASRAEGEVKRLREALEYVADFPTGRGDVTSGMETMADEARAALKEGE